MKTALLSKAALCVCPPALVVTAVATVPVVRHAAHKIASPRAPAKAAPRRSVPRPALAAAVAPCLPGGPLTALPDISLASLETDSGIPGPGSASAFGDSNTHPYAIVGGGFGGGSNPSFFFGGGGGGGAGGGGSATPGGGSPAPGGGLPNPGDGIPTGTGPTEIPTKPDVTAAVPEPATWLMMLSGFGIVGMAIRSRRIKSSGSKRRGSRRTASHRSRKFAALALFGGGEGLATSGIALPAQAIAVKTGVRGAMLAKAALCVCPTVALVGAAATVPPIKSAVFSATAPKVEKVRHIAVPAAPSAPCVDDARVILLPAKEKPAALDAADISAAPRTGEPLRADIPPLS